MSEYRKLLIFKIITFTIMVIFILYFFEFFLLSFKKKIIVPNEDKYLAFNKEKKKNSNLKPYVNSMYILNHSLKFPEYFSPSTFSNSEVFTCNENGYYPIIKTDKHGFYNSNLIWNEKFNDVFLGDSFTAGSCVNIEDNIISNYVKNNQNIIAINLGSPGSFPLLELLKLKEYIFIQNNFYPNRIYWVYYEGNDLRELQNFYKRYNDSYVFNYIDNENYLNNLVKFNEKRNQELHKSLDYAMSIIENSDKNKNKHKYKFYHFLTFAKIRTLLKDIFFNENQNIEKDTLEVFEKILKSSKKIIDKSKTELIFVYLPTIERYKKYRFFNISVNKKSGIDKDLKYYEILNILESLNIKVIDIKKEVFDKHTDPLSLFPFRKHHHYNAKGYELIGNYLYQEKIKN